MAKVVVREGYIWSRNYNQSKLGVVRIVGLSPAEREQMRSQFVVWLKQFAQQGGGGNTYLPFWFTYPERPTWLDVQVPGLSLRRVKEGVLLCLPKF